jgi:electron transport complex protein RnfB
MPERRAPSVTVEQIDSCLPQTQCTQCGYPHCRAYAEAIARGEAGINRCPPGDAATIRALADLLGEPVLPLDARLSAQVARSRAVIDEALCIGCRKCLEVCPVDAIVGARRLMHTVIAADCTGCGLCLPPCPVNCIAMVAATPPAPGDVWPEYARAETERWRALAENRRRRLARQALREAPARSATVLPPPTESARIRAEIRAAVARDKARRAPRPDTDS